MLALPASGSTSWPSNRAPAFVAAEIERHLQASGATRVVRSGHRVEFEHLPLRQFFHAFRVENGSYEVSAPDRQIRVRYRAAAPVLPVLVPFMLVAVLMGAMAVQSGAPVPDVALVLLVAAVAVIAGTRYAAGFGLRAVAQRARAASS